MEVQCDSDGSERPGNGADGTSAGNKKGGGRAGEESQPGALDLDVMHFCSSSDGASPGSRGDERGCLPVSPERPYRTPGPVSWLSPVEAHSSSPPPVTKTRGGGVTTKLEHRGPLRFGPPRRQG